MPDKYEHLAQAQHNRDFWSSFDINTSVFLDWVATGIFYEGVHWVEAYFAKTKFHSVDHGKRMLQMRHDLILRPISNDLEQLKFDSENARYQCYKYSKQDINKDLIPKVNQIKSHIQSVIE